MDTKWTQFLIDIKNKKINIKTITPLVFNNLNILCTEKEIHDSIVKEAERLVKLLN